jgi:hypothetical protein
VPENGGLQTKVHALGKNQQWKPQLQQSSFDAELSSDKCADQRTHGIPRIETENGCGNSIL